MITHFSYRTRYGVFSLATSQDGRWHPLLDGEDLGSYWSVDQALDDLLGDHCFSNSARVDTSRVGLPSDLSEWVRS